MESLSRIGSPSAMLPLSIDRDLGANASPQAVGQAFEAMFASILVKQMRQSVDSESMFGQDTGEVVSGLFDHFLGEHIARTGGVGVGAMIRRQLEQRLEREHGSDLE